MGCDGGGQCIDAHPATWTSDEKTAFLHSTRPSEDSDACFIEHEHVSIARRETKHGGYDTKTWRWRRSLRRSRRSSGNVASRSIRRSGDASPTTERDLP